MASISTSKLAPFVLKSFHGLTETLIRSGVRLVKVINNPGQARDIHEALGDGCIVIARAWGAGDDFIRYKNAKTDPKNAAAAWWKDMELEIAQAPFAYWEAFNEMSDWSIIEQYGEFEAERQRILYNEGRRACIGNFSTGCPDVSDYPGDSRKDYWPQMYPALEACHKYQNILGLHEYGGLWLWLYYGPNQHAAVVNRRWVEFPTGTDEGWLFGRYRKVWRRHIAANGWTRIRIALTEFGLDRAGLPTTDALTGGASVGPWKQCGPHWLVLSGRGDTESYYIDQLRWADEQMQRDPYLLGATIFCWGTDDETWGEWDVQGGVADALALRMQAMQTYSDAHRVVTAPKGLFLRPRPNQSSEHLSVLPPAEIVQAFAEQNGWTYVKTQTHLQGFVMSRWLSPIHKETS